jgi:tRNA dimethylallyltransferase
LALLPKKVYVICGPTASGKTSVAIKLAQYLHTEIVSADSRQCYQGMSIGTAQPSAQELLAVRHYFINEYPVSQVLTAADYERIALHHIEDILAAHDTAVVCGGTGLYIKALCEGLDEMPEMNADVSRSVEEGYRIHGLDWLQRSVQAEDPAFYAIGEIHNPARLMRALIFVRSVGESITLFRSNTKKNRPFSIVKVGLDIPRKELYERIGQRVDEMMVAGLQSEVEQLMPFRGLKNLQTVGYSELFDLFDGKCTLAHAVEKIKQHTRNYAKRQLTWFRKDPEIHWLSNVGDDIVRQIVTMK